MCVCVRCQVVSSCESALLVRFPWLCQPSRGLFVCLFIAHHCFIGSLLAGPCVLAILPWFWLNSKYFFTLCVSLGVYPSLWRPLTGTSKPLTMAQWSCGHIWAPYGSLCPGRSATAACGLALPRKTVTPSESSAPMGSYPRCRSTVTWRWPPLPGVVSSSCRLSRPSSKCLLPTRSQVDEMCICSFLQIIFRSLLYSVELNPIVLVNIVISGVCCSRVLCYMLN